MGLGNVNGADMKSKINEIVKAGDTTSRSGRIDILKKISDLGKALLDDINVQDETLVEIEQSYDDIIDEIEELNAEMDAGSKKIDGMAGNVEDINKELAEFNVRLEAGEELSEDELARYRELFQQQNRISYEMNYENKNQKKLQKGQSDYNNKLGQYSEIINNIQETMGGYAEAGDAVRQASHDYGRPHMADNLENKSGGGNALKRNESCWGSGVWDVLTLGITAACRESNGGNKTEQAVADAGLSGMGDGADGTDMTYHDNENGGYHAEYDVMQYGIGGELRDLTAKTWSYGKTVTTASNDMEKRADAFEKKRNPGEEPPTGGAQGAY